MSYSLYVISYDIPEDKRRTKLHRILEGFGDPVQFSVFEAKLTPKTRERMIRLVEKIINTKEDKVRIYYLCASCREKIKLLGSSEKKPFEDEGFKII